MARRKDGYKNVTPSHTPWFLSLRALWARKWTCRVFRGSHFDILTVTFEYTRPWRHWLTLYWSCFFQAECKLYGHLTVENELLIIITVDSRKPTLGQIHACKIEAERFNKYVNNRSPVATTSYFLSLLKASKLQVATYKSVKSSSSRTFDRTKSYTLISLISLISLLLLHLIR